ncbi:MAG: ribbon-helix-helix domain-containing protein [bacterium]|nr:ribbon-helix-helix domain-containing protein [bacterium]
MGNKKVFSTSIDLNCIKALKHLAVDTDRSLGRLLEEAIKDLVEKYKKEIETERN